MFKNVHELFPAHAHAVLCACVQRYVGMCLNNIMHPRQALYQLNYTLSFRLNSWKQAAYGRDNVNEADRSGRAARAATAVRSTRNWAAVGKLPYASVQYCCH